MATADASGQVSWTFVVPADFEVGPHTGTATSVTVGDSTVASFEVYLTASGGDGPGGSGPSSGSGSNNAGNGTGSDYLARTGTNDLALVLVAALLLVATGAVVRVRARRAS